MALRDEFGRRHIQIDLLATAGTTTIAAHGFTTLIDEIDVYSCVIHGLDGNLIESNNPAGIANSDYNFKLSATDYELEVPVGQTNISGQTARVYVITRSGI